jgi:hypothetical protein
MHMRSPTAHPPNCADNVQDCSGISTHAETLAKLALTPNRTLPIVVMVLCTAAHLARNLRALPKSSVESGVRWRWAEARPVQTVRSGRRHSNLAGIHLLRFICLRDQ